MTLLTVDNVSIAYGHQPLLKNASLRVEAGERLCLIGRNGMGKSTLFRAIVGDAQLDDGEIQYKDTLRISHLQQDVPVDTDQTIYEVVAAGLGDLGELLTAYHAAAQKTDEDSLNQLAELQQRIEAVDGWNANQKIDTALSRLALPADKRIADCSGGIRRRVLLAQALVCEPDLLLLDEPTNHMDIDAITWLEEFLLGYNGALMFITHDRALIKRLATSIAELDLGELTHFPGDYDYYLRKKAELLDIEARANERFDKKLAEHEVWIRQGIKARRTRNEGKVRRLEAMRREHAERLKRQGKVKLALDRGELSGKIVAELDNVSFSYESQPIIQNFSTCIMRGDRIGIIGPNGAGKSTLLRLLLGQLTPDSGKTALGTKLEIAYFDQQRDQLDLDKTVRENLGEGTDYVTIGGKPKHVISYLKDFLFPPARIDSPVKSLSGGERNRLLLARLFASPSNLLVLDEPTNDLDVETLELLEELLADYNGTLLLVSHDRAFLDNVVTSTIVFEGNGHLAEYVGGYQDWLRQRPTKTEPVKETPKPTPKPKASPAPSKPKQKLSYKEKRELEMLPEMIEQLETEQGELEQQISDPDFYKQEKTAIAETMGRLEKINEELTEAYARWEYLDSLG